MLKLHDIKVWAKAVDLSTEVYHITQKFPAEERYGLTAQIRRATVSIPSNIAEGYGRNNPGDFTRFLHIASGSLYELRTQSLIARNIGFLTPTEHTDLEQRIDEVERMLIAFTHAVEKHRP